MERRNVSFPEETRRQLAALASWYGGNQSEANRVAIDRLYRHHVEPQALPNPSMLERLEAVLQQGLVLIEAERARQAPEVRPLAELPTEVRAALAAMAVQDAIRDGVEQQDAERRLLTALIMNERTVRLDSVRGIEAALAVLERRIDTLDERMDYATRQRLFLELDRLHEQLEIKVVEAPDYPDRDGETEPS